MKNEAIGGKLKPHFLLTILVLFVILLSKTRLAMAANLGMISVVHCANLSYPDKRSLLFHISATSRCDQAKVIFEEILTHDNNQITARFGLALHEFYSSQYVSAAQAFQEENLKKRVSDRIALMLYIKQHHYFRSLGEYDKAIEVIKQGISIYPESGIPKILLARVLIYDLHRYDEGRQQIKQALSTQELPATWEFSSLNLLGWASRYEGKQGEALYWFDRATRVSGVNHLLAYKAGYAVAKESQDRLTVLKWLDRALAETPNDSSLHEALLNEWLISMSDLTSGRKKSVDLKLLIEISEILETNDYFEQALSTWQAIETYFSCCDATENILRLQSMIKSGGME